MHDFRDGEEARVLQHGIEVEVVVFRQSGELLYVFDKQNRLYQFHVRDVSPARGVYRDTCKNDMERAQPA